MEKTFTVVGTSVLNGVRKVRFANDLRSRIKVLSRKHTDINLIYCVSASKVDAVKFAITQETQFTEAERELFAAYIKANEF